MRSDVSSRWTANLRSTGPTGAVPPKPGLLSAVVLVLLVVGAVALLIANRVLSPVATVGRTQAISVASRSFASNVVRGQSPAGVQVTAVHFQPSRNQVRDSNGNVVFTYEETCVPLGCHPTPVWLVELRAQPDPTCSLWTGDVLVDATNAKVAGDSFVCRAAGAPTK
jgi:hypothetical protein